MATLEQNIQKSIPTARQQAGRNPFDWAIKMISSVRFGVILLIVLGLACFLGMVIMQQSVDGFDRYLAALTPAQRSVYGRLGLFDIYHSWYFNGLLFALAVNIILSSIERFPKTWRQHFKPAVTQFSFL